ncbi:unnamed protein product [Strongylus vulgaris]|uniref:Uncharacterized protein n=1 Tax=Strongylus vulgaris TaxID=40348 RepID=A0A3P7KRA0_STRVU|nr:unnamed protein product [Strongylus vulgaris]
MTLDLHFTQIEILFVELTSVEHQKAWQAGFGRTLLNELARGEQSLMQKGDLHGEDGSTSAIVATRKKTRNIRQRQRGSSQSSNEEETPSTITEKTTTKVKKSIYSDDDDDAQPKFIPPKKNFPGELKPGLNRVGLPVHFSIYI